MSAAEKSAPKITIERGIAMPEKKKIGRPRLYQLDKMEMGDRMTIPVGADRTISQVLHTLRTVARKYGKKSGKEFATRSVPEEQVVRVWRTA